MNFSDLVKLFRCQHLRIEQALDARFRPVTDRLDRLERHLEDIAADIDEIDRYNRPHGDGTKLPRNRRQW